MIALDTDALPKNGKQKRRRKVYYAFYEHECGRPHPMIRLSGKYLAAFDFQIGDAIEVELDSRRILITKISEPVRNKKA